MSDEASDPNWNTTYGWQYDEVAAAAVSCNDGGYLLAGGSLGIDGGDWDAWLVRTDIDGGMLWNRTIGSLGFEVFRAAIQCQDGGFAFAGQTSSWDAQALDVWLVRTDSAGLPLWNKTFGDIHDDAGYSLTELNDGGFAVGGTIEPDSSGFTNAWLIRTDSNGNHVWNRKWGTTFDQDCVFSVIKSLDGSIVLTGYTYSFAFPGTGETFLAKVDTGGLDVWNHTYDTADDTERGISVIQCSDGGYAIAGRNAEFHGGWNYDFALIRTNETGDLTWEFSYGGDNDEQASSLVEIPGQGFAVLGYSPSPGGESTDFWLLRVDKDGGQLWNRTYGGTLGENGVATVETVDGGYVLFGETSSVGAGGSDFWLIEVQPISWIDSPIDVSIEEGADFRRDLNVSAPEGVSHWWLNESMFNIDTAGVITNVTDLPVGTYGVRVRVNDSNGDFLASDFALSVFPSAIPTWIQPPSNQIIELGELFDYDLNATDPSGIGEWAVDDTIRFAIDSQGMIHSMGTLSVGTYDLTVYVSDTLGNMLSGQITVTVQDTTPPEWTVIPSNRVIAYGSQLEYQLSATDLGGIDHWTVNDTSNFEITENGLLLSIHILPVGEYGVVVTASDPGGNLLQSEFIVRVERIDGGDDWLVQTALAIGIIIGAVGVTVVIAIVIYIRRPKV
ncbi:MAG: hypothetical protein JSW05_06065 [Candidatus Thorarchaeota archaeon]|nr:MAG: hypothetical protein JSW05_06065 [Candidatus Thorarchaeota archaeon]